MDRSSRRTAGTTDTGGSRGRTSRRHREVASAQGVGRGPVLVHSSSFDPSPDTRDPFAEDVLHGRRSRASGQPVFRRTGSWPHRSGGCDDGPVPLDVELAEIRDFLAALEPFRSLPADVLEALPARLSIVYRRRGDVVLAAGTTPAELLVVRSGAVELRDPDGELVERAGAGLCVGGSALARGTAQPVEIGRAHV